MEPTDSLNDDTESSSELNPRIPGSLPVASVLSNQHPCSYLPNRTANLPLILPGKRLEPHLFDDVLNAGMRRAGYFLYYVDCAGCRACEPTRIPVRKFRWTDSWRRIRNRGDKQLQVTVESPEATEEKLILFNRHRDERDLADSMTTYRLEDYESFLVESSSQWTTELQFRTTDNRLVALSLIDCGENSVSAVYTYFDPDFSKLSLGTYSILKQIEFCLNTNREFLYLGLYVADNPHLNYKARFLPQERFIQDKWIEVSSDLRGEG